MCGQPTPIYRAAVEHPVGTVVGYGLPEHAGTAEFSARGSRQDAGYVQRTRP